VSESLDHLFFCNTLRVALSLAALFSSELLAADAVSIGNRTFINKGLVGVGRIPADLRDKLGETFGSGSGLAADLKTWRRADAAYRGEFFLLPDRGYNITGTENYRSRIQRLSIAFEPEIDPAALPVAERQRSVSATLIDTIVLTDAAGEPMTGLDPSEGGVRPAANGFPDLPQASNGRVSMDAEALVLMPDGSFFVGDEYGPYLYRFSPAGRMLAAIRPPDAFIPRRNGKVHFSSNNPGPGAHPPKPKNPETGRQNNQGFEGSRSPRAGNSSSQRSKAPPARTAPHRKRDAIPVSSIMTFSLRVARCWCGSTSCRCRSMRRNADVPG